MVVGGYIYAHHWLDLVSRIIVVPNKLDADDVAVVGVVLVLLAGPAQVVDVPTQRPIFRNLGVSLRLYVRRPE